MDVAAASLPSGCTTVGFRLFLIDPTTTATTGLGDKREHEADDIDEETVIIPSVSVSSPVTDGDDDEDDASK
jgi:hypothetical protein